MIANALLIVAAGVMMLPEPDSSVMRAIGKGAREPFVVADVFLAPDGTVLDCEIIQPATPSDSLIAGCERTIGLNSRSVATGPDGAPAFGLVTIAQITQPMPRKKLSEIRLDKPPVAELRVPSLPEGNSRIEIYLNVFIDGTGRVSQCEATREIPESVVDLACAQAANESFPKRQGTDGSVVSYVAQTHVDLISASSTPTDG